MLQRLLFASVPHASARLLITGLALAPAALLAPGCSSSHGADDDTGTILFDAAGIDVGIRADGGVDAYMAACGNAIIEGGEECDDGNTAAGDGCDASCDREAFCGDMNTDAGEVCDDGNHRSNDGCRSDCLSDESCGNMIVDYAAGEICDGTPGCSATCDALDSCPDGMVDPGEDCDDDNAERWDACGVDCRETVTFALDMPEFAPMDVGCDYSGDGAPDNRFARAAGSTLDLLNMFFGGGGPTFLISFLGLDDPGAINDPSLRTAWLTGEMGPGGYTIAADALNADGTPATSLESSIVSRALDGGPEDLDFPIAFLPITLRDAHILGTTSGTAARVTGIEDGMVCGVVPLEPLTFLNESLIESFGSMGGFTIDVDPPCEGTEQSTMVDWMIGGARIAIINLRATAPDVDLDGDGLESFEVARGAGCQPVVTACIDGDGTRVEGRECYLDERFADGYSAALTYTANRVMTLGSM
jgi:cysteine-rich repeat protein